MEETPKRTLSLFDCVCLIVGIIIGAGIYQTTPDVARGASSIWGVFLIWIVGGVLSLFGALSYAELASAYPKAGGDYVYLSRAFGRWAGFLFGWMQLVIVRPGDITIMAFIFATYAVKLFNPLAHTLLSAQVYACLAIVVLTIINIMGVKLGKWTQNILTIIKVLGLLAIFGVALAVPQSEPSDMSASGSFPLTIALILVLFTFGGWNEMAFVAAEVKNPSRNILRALLLGTAAVTILYLLINGAFIYALGYDGMATSSAVAADAISPVFPDLGARLISVLICISALGAINGLIFAGARISYAVGCEYPFFHVLGRWDHRTQTPVWALLLQGEIALLLAILLGSFLDTIIYTAAAVYSFYLATSLAVMVLRCREPNVPRPYKVTGFPIPTIIFCLVCAFLIYSAVDYKPYIALIPCGICLLGLPVYWITYPSKN
ncbi:MAG: amino acid permease [Sedimentisphaerales bacterium]|nr:amino acid permease [Sedimentisphaerales bacterium]